MRSWPGVIAAALLGLTVGALLLTIADFRRDQATRSPAGELAPDIATQLVAANDRWVANLQARIRRQRAVRQATRTARRAILGNLADTDVRVSVPRAALGGAAKRRLAALDTRLAGIPRDSSRIDVDRLRLADVNSATALVELQVQLPAPTGKRNIDHSIDVELRRRNGTWTLVDVEAAATGLFVYAAPTVLESEKGIAFVGESSRRPRMQELSVLAEREAPRLRERFGDLAGPARATTFILEDSDQADPLLGRTPPDLERNAPAWTYDSGDILLNWSRFGDAGRVVQDGTFVHELTHLVLRPVTGSLPVMLSEGIAMREEIGIPEAAGQRFDLAPLNEAFADGTVNYLGLLRSDETSLPGDPLVGYLAGYATATYLLQRGGDDTFLRFLASIRSGLEIDEALRRSYRLTASRLRGEVRRWAEREASP